MHGVVYHDWQLGARYCVSQPATGCSSYTHIILKIMAHLQVLYNHLEDQQVAPPTLSLFWRYPYSIVQIGAFFNKIRKTQ